MIMSPIDPEKTTLADLAVTCAGASRVFHRHGLDFCCHGNVSLEQACQKRGLDSRELIAEIENEERDDEGSFERWDEQPMTALIDHILVRFHEPLRQELPRLIEMARRVERVHGEKPSCPEGVGDLLEQMQGELWSHMEKEEQILFPMIRDGRGFMAEGPVQVMQLEHDGAADALARLRQLAHDFTAPEEACKTWRAMYLGLAELDRDLKQHIHLENNVLFPQALATPE
jgi:regulator of cell morphogenesis and NO signaling